MTLHDDILTDATTTNTKLAIIQSAEADLSAAIASATTALSTLTAARIAAQSSNSNLITLMDDCACDTVGGGGGGFPTWLPLVGTTAPLYYADFVNGNFWAAGATQASLTAFLTAAGFTANSTPRIHPTKGLYLEGARTNRVYPSNDYSSANWTKTNVTQTASSITANPDEGALVMTKVTDNATNGEHAISCSVVRSAGFTLCNSQKIKAGTATKGRIADVSGTSGFYADFDLSTGTISSATNLGGSTPIQAFIDNLGDGVYRVGVSGVNGSLTSANFKIYMRNSAGATSYAGSGDYFYVAHSQCEGAPYPTSYYATTTAMGTRPDAYYTRSIASSPAGITRLFKGRTAMGKPLSGEYHTAWHIDNAVIPLSGYNDEEIWRYSDGTFNDRVTKGNGTTSVYTQYSYGMMADDTEFTLASATDSTSMRTSLNGGAAHTVASSGWPTDFNHDRWGTQLQTIRFWDSTVKEIGLWEVAATATEVQTLSA